MKKIKSILSCGVIAMTLAGCQQVGISDESREIYLEASEEIITLTDTATSKEINIETNAKGWIARLSEGSEWLHLNRNPSALILSSDGNATGKERSATITVEAENKVIHLLVRQRGAATKISLSEKQINVPMRGGLYTVNVSGNGTGWKIDGAELYQWIVVQQAHNGMSLQILKNDTPSTRIGKIYVVTESGTPAELVIVQEGDSPYTLPYMPAGPIYQTEVLRDAREREMFFIKTETTLRGETIYHFNAGDKAKSKVQYKFRKGIERYISFTVVTEGSDYGISDDFETHLSRLGFGLTSKNISGAIFIKNYVRFTPHYTVVAQVQVPTAGGQTTVVYYIEEVQPKPMPTFDNLPYRNPALLNKADFFAVKKWEENEGESVEVSRERGQKNPNIIARAEFSSVTNKDTHMGTVYFFEEVEVPYISKLSQKIDIYGDISLALWRNSEGRYFLTNEMKRLLKDEGFEFKTRSQTGPNQEWISYLNMSQGMAMLFTNINQPDGRVFLGISIFKIANENEETSYNIALENAQNAIRR